MELLLVHNLFLFVQEMEDVTWTRYQILDVLSFCLGFNENIRAYFSGEEM